MKILKRLVFLSLFIPTAAFARASSATIPDKPLDASNPWVCDQTWLPNGVFARHGIGHLSFCEPYV